VTSFYRLCVSSIVDVSSILTTYIFKIVSLFLKYKWPPYLNTLYLYTSCGCLVTCITVRERSMRIRCSLMRGVLRRHDFANLTICCKRFTVLYLIAYNCLHIGIFKNHIHGVTPNVDGPVGRGPCISIRHKQKRS